MGYHAEHNPADPVVWIVIAVLLQSACTSKHREAVRQRDAEVSAEAGRQRDAEVSAEAGRLERGTSDECAGIENADGTRWAVGDRWEGPSGYAMVRVPAGVFLMGSPSCEAGRFDDEVQHRVCITHDLWVGEVEVTQGLWSSVMGENPSAVREQYWGGEAYGACRESEGVSLVSEDYPVMCIDWYDAVGFANALSARDGLRPAYRLSGSEVSVVMGADGYRLPTESEWEYAARGGGRGMWGPTESEGSTCRYGNVSDQTAKSRWPNWEVFGCTDGVAGLARVGSYEANGYGLYDTLGNVWEWTWDRYGAYPRGTAVDPTGPAGALSAPNRVCRGGSSDTTPLFNRVAKRSVAPGSSRANFLGLRLVRTIPRSLDLSIQVQ